jgi:hypothetical protein
MGSTVFIGYFPHLTEMILTGFYYAYRPCGTGTVPIRSRSKDYFQKTRFG